MVSAPYRVMVSAPYRVIDGYGNELANRITGNELANWLDGLGGADSLIGGFGDDSYRVDNADDLVIEAGYEGYDSIETTVSYTLAVMLLGADVSTTQSKRFRRRTVSKRTDIKKFPLGKVQAGIRSETQFMAD